MAQIFTTWINGLTNDYNKSNGIFTKNNNLLTEVNSRIVTPIGSYYFDKSFGSNIPLWLNNRSASAQLQSNDIVTELIRCTQIIINQKRARTIAPRLTAPLTKNAIFFLINIIDINGIAFQLDSNFVSIPSQVSFG